MLPKNLWVTLLLNWKEYTAFPSASIQTIDVGVSVDGTWQRRGFSSNNGVVTAISIDTGKVVDVEIMSKICKGCKQKEHLKTVIH